TGLRRHHAGPWPDELVPAGVGLRVRRRGGMGEGSAVFRPRDRRSSPEVVPRPVPQPMWNDRPLRAAITGPPKADAASAAASWGAGAAVMRADGERSDFRQPAGGQLVHVE